MRIEVHRLHVVADLEHAALLRGLRLRGTDVQRPHRGRRRTELDQVTTAECRVSSRVHVHPPAPDARGPGPNGQCRSLWQYGAMLGAEDNAAPHAHGPRHADGRAVPPLLAAGAALRGAAGARRRARPREGPRRRPRRVPRHRRPGRPPRRVLPAPRRHLFFGRNEECGLRCVYHGWKFDVDGSCVDMPTSRPRAASATRCAPARIRPASGATSCGRTSARRSTCRRCRRSSSRCCRRPIASCRRSSSSATGRKRVKARSTPRTSRSSTCRCGRRTTRSRRRSAARRWMSSARAGCATTRAPSSTWCRTTWASWRAPRGKLTATISTGASPSTCCRITR